MDCERSRIKEKGNRREKLGSSNNMGETKFNSNPQEGEKHRTPLPSESLHTPRGSAWGKEAVSVEARMKAAQEELDQRSCIDWGVDFCPNTVKQDLRGTYFISSTQTIRRLKVTVLHPFCFPVLSMGLSFGSDPLESFRFFVSIASIHPSC